MVGGLSRTAQGDSEPEWQGQIALPALGMTADSVLHGKANFYRDLPMIDLPILDVTARFSHL